MLDTTTQIRRTVALAGVLAVVVAPGAYPRVPEAPFVLRSSATDSRDPERAASAPSMADLAARREARAIKAWRAANPPTVIEVSSPDGDWFDLPSAGVGAAVPLTLVLIEVAGRWVLRRRRDTEARHRLA
jgi:hypothetical protein